MVKEEEDVMYAMAGPLLTISLLHLCCGTGIAEQHPCIGAAVPLISKAERRNGWPESCEVKDVAAKMWRSWMTYTENAGDMEDVEDGTSRTRSTHRT